MILRNYFKRLYAVSVSGCLIILSGSSMIQANQPAETGESARLLQKSFLYRSQSEQLADACPEALEEQGIFYRLQGVTYEVEPQYHTYSRVSNKMWQGQEYQPEPVLEIDDLNFFLTKTTKEEWLETGRTKYLSTSRTHLGGQTAAETVEIETRDTVTDEIFVAEVPKTDEQRDGADWWQGGLEISVTFVNYGNEDGEYEIGGATVTLTDDDSPEFENYTERILHQEQLDPAAYRITGIFWDGDAYTNSSGLLCRDAVAKGDKLVTRHKDIYQGNVAQPDIMMVIYTDHYQSEPYEYLITAHATYQMEEKAAQVRAKSSFPMTEIIMVALELLMCILLFILLFAMVRGKIELHV